MVGRTISQYEILEKLGAGGMGVVYKARDTKLNRLVALKFLPPHLSASPEEKHRFLHEARAASALDHPNIGVVHDIGETPDGQMFIVMAYHEGETLKARIERAYEQGETVLDKVARGLSIAEALDIARQIAAGLAKAHEHGITHRDIKPGNVIITTDGVAKIIDFGLAKLSNATATIAGSTKGTAAYMSPEQATGKEVDARTDVWSLGVALYEMLAGALPFQGAHQAAQISAILSTKPKPLRELRPDVPEEVERIVARALEKDAARRYASGAELARDLAACLARISAPVFAAPARRRVAVPLAVAAAVILAGAAWFGWRQSKIRWAHEQALPEIERLAGAGKVGDAFLLARQAASYIEGDPALAKLWGEVSVEFSAETDPPGAEVEIQPFSQPESQWMRLGTTPFGGVRVPRTFARWRITKPGFAVLQGARATWAPKLVQKLEPEGSTPPGMVLVPGSAFTVNVGQVGQLPTVQLDTYWIDKYEITNRQYKEFIDAGGYQKREYWKHRFLKDGRELTWEHALEEFRDSTGRPGPSTWEAGRYPDGQEDHPVAGVSWFEAAAYAEFAGKSLPTIFHWYMAANVNTGAFITPASNFSRKGAAPVGKYQGIGPNGTFDMAGNVKEWCWTPTGDGLRYILGGGWNEPMYMFHDADARSPWDRSKMYGFRCVRYPAPPGPAVLAPQKRVFRDYSKERPVSDEVFTLIKRLYAYDRTELNPKTELVDDSAEAWKREKISIDPAYTGTRLQIFLFLPKSSRPPFQVVVYCPGASALRVNTSADLFGLRNSLDFVIKSGRAVAYPVYFGTYERIWAEFRTTQALTDQQRREFFSNITKDLGRTIDYLETRKDIDTKKLAYMGTSFGAAHGLIWSTIEDRIRVCVYQDGGFFFTPRAPEVDAFNFAPRMQKPVIMLNGRHDFTFPLETSQKHMFRLLGTPEKDKRHVIFETAHDVTVMRTEFVREVLNWLDKYLGKVQ